MASNRVIGIVLLVLLLSAASLGQAQENPLRKQLYITATDTSALPTVTLQVYGVDSDGTPLDLTAQDLVVFHDGTEVDDVQVGRQVETGSLTIFLIDATSGIAEQLPAIQQAIEQYASPDYMQEQSDLVAIYRVGEEGASSLLEPTGFFNSVRNLFAEPLQPAEGATALVDSLGGLLEEMPALAPNPELPMSIVVFSDGTDAVSTAYEAEQIADLAAERDIFIHTVWLDNQALNVGQEVGRAYLQRLAQESRGLFARLDEPAAVEQIFVRISDISTQRLLHYQIPELTGGTFPVILSLADDPAVQADTTITVNASSPTVALNIPPESRTLTLPSLEDPVELAFSAEISWLDGTERTLEAAQLLVNNTPVADVPVNSLERFEVEIGNFVYGDNTLRLAVVDEQGAQGLSAPVTLTVVEGEQEIPEALQAGGSLLAAATPICLAAILLLAIFGLGGFYAYRSGRLGGVEDMFRPRRRPAASQEAVAQPPAAAPVVPPLEQVPQGTAPAYLTVIDAETQMESAIPLTEDEIRLGRSPTLSDIAFERDLTVSRLHATVIWDGHTYRIYDDDSTSGTWVNDQQVPDYGAQLFDGDEIFLGKVHLRFHQR